MNQESIIQAKISKFFRSFKAIILITIFNIKEVIFAHKFFLYTLFRASVSDVPPPIKLKIDYVQKLQFKLIILLRFFLKNQSWGKQWYERVQNSILENLKQQKLDRSQLKMTLPTVQSEEISSQEFWQKYVKTGTPVVIKGGAKHTYAYQNWTAAMFGDRFSDFEVNILERGDLQPYMLKLKEVIDSQETERPLYSSSFNILSSYPELFEELDCLNFREYMGGKLGMFLGSQLKLGVHQGTGTSMHCEYTNTLFFQLEGKKKWTFVHPDYLWLMYPMPEYYICYSALKKDDDEQNLNQYAPLHQYCPKYEAVLEPGDILFNPSWLWHEVDNLTDETIAVSTSWFCVGVKRNNTFFDLMQLLSPKVWKDQFYTLSKVPDEPNTYPYRKLIQE